MRHNCPWCGRESDVILPEVAVDAALDAANTKITELELDISLLQVAHGKALADLTTEKPVHFSENPPVPDLETAQNTAATIIAGMSLASQEN